MKLGKPSMRVQIRSRNFIEVSCIIVFWLILILVPWSWQTQITDFNTDLLLRIRGGRPISEKIVYVYLGEDDVGALGGWPVTRDY